MPEQEIERSAGAEGCTLQDATHYEYIYIYNLRKVSEAQEPRDVGILVRQFSKHQMQERVS